MLIGALSSKARVGRGKGSVLRGVQVKSPCKNPCSTGSVGVGRTANCSRKGIAFAKAPDRRPRAEEASGASVRGSGILTV